MRTEPVRPSMCSRGTGINLLEEDVSRIRANTCSLPCSSIHFEEERKADHGERDMR
nr:hypothetical protein [Methanothrix sp.]